MSGEMLVRIKPSSKTETFTLFDPHRAGDSVTLRKAVGWYKVDAGRAAKLAEAREDENDPASKLLCDVEHPEDALERARQEARQRIVDAGLTIPTTINAPTVVPVPVNEQPAPKPPVVKTVVPVVTEPEPEPEGPPKVFVAAGNITDIIAQRATEHEVEKAKGTGGRASDAFDRGDDLAPPAAENKSDVSEAVEIAKQPEPEQAQGNPHAHRDVPVKPRAIPRRKPGQFPRRKQQQNQDQSQEGCK